MPISLPVPSRAHCNPYLSVGSEGVAAKSLDLLQFGCDNLSFAAKRAILLQKVCGGKADGCGDGRACQPHRKLQFTMM